MTDVFELVYTMTGWYDGPIEGVADYRGRPHLYEAQWDDEREVFGPLFRLTPIDYETRDLAIEDWELWLRWDRASRVGPVDDSPDRVLPADRVRHGQLQELLATRLVHDPTRSFEVCGEFRLTPRLDSWPTADVRWYDPA